MNFKKVNSRRNFLQAIGALFSIGLVFTSNYVPNHSFSVRRIVKFPRPMSAQEFEAISHNYCNVVEIHKYNTEMMVSGELLKVDNYFLPESTYYNLTFKSKDSFYKYISSIDASWFDQKKFEELGFQVDFEYI